MHFFLSPLRPELMHSLALCFLFKFPHVHHRYVRFDNLALRYTGGPLGICAALREVRPSRFLSCIMGLRGWPFK